MSMSFRVRFQIKELDFSKEVMMSIGDALGQALPKTKIIFDKDRTAVHWHFGYTIKKEGIYFFGLSILEKSKTDSPWSNSRIPEGYLWLSLSVDNTIFDYFSWLDDDFLYDSEEQKCSMRRSAEEGTEDFLTCIKVICECVNPVYAAGTHEADLFRSELNFEDFLYKITYFSPERVKKIGRGKILSTPAWRVEELKNKGILLVTAKHFTVEIENWKIAAKHLGLRIGSADEKSINEQE